LEGEQLVPLAAQGIEAGIADPLLDRGGLRVVQLRVDVVAERDRIAPRAALDRDDRLAGDVAAQDQMLDAVEAPGVQELAEADVGAVDVAGEEDARLLSGLTPPPEGHPADSVRRDRAIHQVEVDALALAVRAHRVP